MSDIITVKTVGIDQFVHDLRSFPKDDFANHVASYVKTHRLDRASLERYAFFFPNRYTRNLIFRDETFEALALCWEPGQVSNVHNHRGQECCVVIAEGELQSQTYYVHDRDEEAGTCRLEGGELESITREQPGIVDLDAPVHQVRNPGEARAMSVHVYSKPFDTCEVYCPVKGTYHEVKLHDFSQYGELTQQPPQDPCGD